jgi:hypothetical protein
MNSPVVAEMNEEYFESLRNKLKQGIRSWPFEYLEYTHWRTKTFIAWLTITSICKLPKSAQSSSLPLKRLTNSLVDFQMQDLSD